VKIISPDNKYEIIPTTIPNKAIRPPFKFFLIKIAIKIATEAHIPKKIPNIEQNEAHKPEHKAITKKLLMVKREKNKEGINKTKAVKENTTDIFAKILF
jgi:hypothetical protein